MGTAILILIGWQLAANAADSKLTVPGPGLVVEAAVDQITSLVLPTAVVRSLLTLIAGMALGAAAGISLGAASGISRGFGDVIGPLARIVYVVPTVAVLPLVIVWFGVFEPARVILIAYACFYEFYMYTRLGVERAYDQFWEPAASMRAGDFTLATRVLLPAAVPYLSTGIRLATTQAIVGLILAEFFTAIRSESDGIGAFILTNGSRNSTSDVFVGILTLMALSLSILAVLRAVERSFSRWHLATRAGG